MKKIIITIDDSKLKGPITENDVLNTIDDRIQDAIDYGYWAELLWNGEYGKEWENYEGDSIPNSVEEAVNVEVIE